MVGKPVGYDDLPLLYSKYLRDPKLIDLSWDATVADARLKALRHG